MIVKDVAEQNAIMMREYVKIEVIPKDKAKITRNLTDWIYREDEDYTLPEWYTKRKEDIQQHVLLQLVEDLKVQLVLDGETREETDVEMYGYGQSKMYGYGQSKMEIKSETSVAICNSKIFVNKKATVIVQEKIDASKV